MDTAVVVLDFGESEFAGRDTGSKMTRACAGTAIVLSRISLESVNHSEEELV